MDQAGNCQVEPVDKAFFNDGAWCNLIVNFAGRSLAEAFVGIQNAVMVRRLGKVRTWRSSSPSFGFKEIELPTLDEEVKPWCSV